MKGALFLALVGAAHATEETQEIPFDNIPLLGKTEDFEMDVTLTVTGFIKSIQVNMEVSAKDGSPWWNDFSLGVIYEAGACKVSYGGFTSTLRYPNYQGTLGILKGVIGTFPNNIDSGPAPVNSNFYVTAGTTIKIGIRNAFGLYGIHEVQFAAPQTKLTLTVDDSDSGGPTGNSETCTAGVYSDGIAPSPPPPIPCNACQFYEQGAMQSDDPGVLCVRHEARGMVCTPRNGPHCDSGKVTCRNDAPCVDAAGTWANKKCARKLRKNKCHKRRVRKFCPSSCGLC